MPKIVTLGVSALLVALLLSPSAGARLDGPSGGGMSSDNVEFIRHIPLAQDGVGGKPIGRYFYANDQNKVMIFDTKDPENPQLVGFVPMPQEWLFSREDLDGNNSVIVMPNTVGASNDGEPTAGTNALYIIDVEDKTNPQIVGKLAGAGSHTSSCILDCTWVYNSNGQIIDIRDPAKPKLAKTKWGDGKPATGAHDVTEVRPGIILTSSNPLMLLDARKDPANPKLLAASPLIENVNVMHSVRWGRNGKDHFFVAGSEQNFVARCGAETNGHFMTIDGSEWEKGILGPVIDRHYETNGTYVDGKPAANQGGCSSHWLELHPTFNNGGIVAHARFEHGTRIMRINSKGKISEEGYFMPWAGMTGASYWITKRVVYALDYNRGIDVIKYTGRF
ncbi:MAG: LVIVD repeat-containing protein [Actinomycetota bacterium]